MGCVYNKDTFFMCERLRMSINAESKQTAIKKERERESLPASDQVGVHMYKGSVTWGSFIQRGCPGNLISCPESRGKSTPSCDC